MKFIFFGTPKFAEIFLEKIIEGGIKPEAVVCNPDRETGRKKIITSPPVKALAEKEKIKVFQPEELDKNFIEEIKKISPDFLVVAAYAKIIPKEILDIPRLGNIGVHPSLLPDLRGSSPIQNAILKGYKESGVTLYLMDEKMDHGLILGQKKVFLEDFSYLEAEKTLALAGGELFLEILSEFLESKIRPKEQEHDKATFTKKIKTEEGEIRMEDLKAALEGKEEKAEEIKRKVLALNPEPGVFVFVSGKRIKILETAVLGGKLVLKKIQTEGKKATKDFNLDIFN